MAHGDECPAALADWVVEAELGRGGMGAVYAARNSRTGDVRALKVIRADTDGASPTALSLFRREVRIGMELHHPHVVRTDEVLREGGLWGIVMELCAGGSLADKVARYGPLSAGQAVPLFLQVLDALVYTHAAHATVHRDIKPHNILFGVGTTGELVAKLADFGLAKAYQSAGLSGLTRTGTAAGTPAFMPRSQVINYKYAGPDVDIWSTAASLYYALTAHTPRDFPDGRDPWLTVATASVVPVGERQASVPDRLARVVDRALTEGPGQGFATAELFRQALGAV
ncbi:serine/threonine-protein kinase [Nocardia pseudovaccinii]|uniref:serine/threonine-protein kinase n=1 Tax=Nocardia pseudovaccinii TaxID=189540 RepID=UPI003D8BFE8C